MKRSLFMMKLQLLATVTGASPAGVTNEIFFVNAEFEAELPSSFVGFVKDLSAKPLLFLALLLLYLLPEAIIINFLLFYAIYM